MPGRFPALRADIVSGLTVFTVLVPSAMAYGELAGVTPQAGLCAGLVAMLVYAALGSSRHLIVGPEATSALLAAVIIAPVAGTGADAGRMAALAGILAAQVGAMLMLGCLLRVGFLADFLARAVLTGYITGAALLVIHSQLGKLFRIKLESDGFFRSLHELAFRLGDAHGPTVQVGAGTILALLAIRRFLPRVPSSLVAVTLGILLCSWFDWKNLGVRVVGEVPAGLPTVGVPQVSWADVQALLPGAASMALLAFSDAVLTGRSFAARHGYAVDANRELFALGAANLGTALFGGFPVAASGSRTAVNEGTGAQSKASGALAAGALAVFLLFFTSVLANLPVAILGAIIIVSSLGMIEFGELARMYRFRWQTFLGAMVTLLGVLVLGVVPAILVAVTLSLFLVIAVISRPLDHHLVRAGGATAFRPIGEGPVYQIEPGLAVYRMDGLMMFANCGRMKSRVLELAQNAQPALHAVVLDLSMSPDTDLTSLTAIEELHSELKLCDVRLLIAEVNPWILQLLQRSGTDRVLGTENIHPNLASAIEAFQRARSAQT
ncbi:MAG: sodium-independent anion transporter [Planctomycetota bacterium]